MSTFKISPEQVKNYQEDGFLLVKSLFTEEETRIIMKQLLSAVEFIHQHHYIHRDIKVNNTRMSF